MKQKLIIMMLLFGVLLISCVSVINARKELENMHQDDADYINSEGDRWLIWVADKYAYKVINPHPLYWLAWPFVFVYMVKGEEFDEHIPWMSIYGIAIYKYNDKTGKWEKWKTIKKLETAGLSMYGFTLNNKIWDEDNYLYIIYDDRVILGKSQNIKIIKLDKVTKKKESELAIKLSDNIQRCYVTENRENILLACNVSTGSIETGIVIILTDNNLNDYSWYALDLGRHFLGIESVEFIDEDKMLIKYKKLDSSAPHLLGEEQIIIDINELEDIAVRKKEN